MDWRTHTPIAKERIGLNELAEAAGVPRGMISSWSLRGAIVFRGVGRGRTRSYTIWQAVHLAIIAEMSAMRLSVVGPGADLTEAMLGYARHRLAEGATPGCIALVPEPGGLDWTIHPVADVGSCGSCIVLDLGRIVGGVAERWDRIAALKPLTRSPGRAKRRSKIHRPCAA